MSETAVILALASQERDLELLESFLGGMGYDTHTAGSFDEFDHLLAGVNPDQVGLGVFDVDGFTEAIWDRCADVSNDGTPVLVLTDSPPEQIRDHALSHSADSVIEKPVRKAELESTIKTLLDR